MLEIAVQVSASPPVSRVPAQMSRVPSYCAWHKCSSVLEIAVQVSDWHNCSFVLEIAVQFRRGRGRQVRLAGLAQLLFRAKDCSAILPRYTT